MKLICPICKKNYGSDKKSFRDHIWNSHEGKAVNILKDKYEEEAVNKAFNKLIKNEVRRMRKGW